MLNRASILGGKRPTLPSRQTRRLVVPGERIELSSLSAHDFESCASTNSATAAYYCFQLAGEVKAGGSRVRLPIPPSRQHRISLSTYHQKSILTLPIL